jgi:hypothetical protein
MVSVRTLQSEIVEDQKIDGDQLAEFRLMAVIEVRVLERLENLIGPDREDRGAAPASDVAERMGEKGLADVDRADDRDVGVRGRVRSLVHRRSEPLRHQGCRGICFLRT